MTDKEAIRRIREHMIIHMLNEPQAIFITEALNLAITALEERSQGDLISRSALQKAIKSYADDQYAENEYLGEYTIMTIIDNAPAVEARPQGEILVEHCFEFNSNPLYCRNCHRKCTWFKCSKCSCMIDTEDKFCKNCGAELNGCAE